MSAASAPMRWILAGGGTGGHVTPALALGEAFTAAGDSVLFVGSARGLEQRLVPSAGFELVTLPAQPVAGHGPLRAVAGAAALAVATVRAVGLLGRSRPHGVVSVGGYAAVPASLAAVVRRVPLFLVEPNAIPGRANRALARFAARIFTGFDAAAEHFAARVGPARVESCGVPLRRALTDAFASAPPRRTPAPPYRLLVFGGSQGARQLNDAMLAALPRLPAERYTVFHQTGAADRERVADGYARAGIEAEVVAFEPNMPSRYSWADLALCRAGALTVAELAAAGLPALLVPYPWAADDHQRANARELEDAGGARVLDPDALDGESLANALEALVGTPGALLAMGQAAAKRGRPEAARHITETCRASAAGRPPGEGS